MLIIQKFLKEKKVADKKEVPGGVLVALAVIAIAVSLIGITTMIGKPMQILGAAVGTVNVTINESVGVSLVTDSINFTTSGINDVKDTTTATDIQSCSAAPCGFNISNDGSVNLNISIDVTSNMFTGSGVNASSFMCNATNFDADSNVSIQGWTGDCTYAEWIDCRDGQTVESGNCFADINFSDGSDVVYLEIQIAVPDAEPSGDKQASITFTGSSAGT